MHLADMSSLSPTARVILGLLNFEPRTGYDIKRVTDRSTRFFWGASYGQIYPELRRLEAAGLVEQRRRKLAALRDEGMHHVPPWIAGVASLVLPSLAPLAEPDADATDALRIAERLALLFPTERRDAGAAMLPDLITLLLDADDGELTRTQKVRRGFIGERYAPLIRALYDGAQEADIATEVTFEDGRKGTIEGDVQIRDVAPHPGSEAAVRPALKKAS